jgi:homeobox protein cut-like
VLPLQVDELKQQVRALQAVGYGTYETDLATGNSSTSSTPGPGAAAGALGGLGPGAAGGSMTLEGMLLAKNRKLEHELTMARLQVRV